MARPIDNVAMLQNPAALVELHGNQFLLQLDTVFDNVCVDPYGYYGWGVYLSEDRFGNTSNPDDIRSEFGNPADPSYGTRRLDRVCNSGQIAPLPQLAFSMHLTPKLSIAFGLVAPAVMGSAQWGGEDGTIQTPDGPRPTPTRYQFVRQAAGFALNPTGSVAYQPVPWLSFGLTLQVLMGQASNYLVMAMRAGTSPANDALTKLTATDFFVPGFTFAALIKPSRYFRLAGTFYWSEGLDGHGELQMTTNYYHQGAGGDELQPLENDPVKLTRVRISLPWTATLAARFALPRGPAPDPDSPKGSDPLKDEIFDIELDAAFTANKTANIENSVNVANEFSLEFRRADGRPQMPLVVKPQDIEEISLDRHVKDVLVLRLGGGVNVIPGRLQLTAGGYFQTRGIEPSYASIDNFNFSRVGLGLGVLVRVGAFDLTASFAHIFQETLTIVPPRHQVRTDATDADPTSGFDQRVYEGNGQLSAQPRVDPNAPAQGDGVAKLTQSAIFESEDLRRRIVNAGRYTASFNVLSIGGTYHF
ncbi:MAG: hypothetical protein ABW321_03090 [Polyangiales bacterium]